MLFNVSDPVVRLSEHLKISQVAGSDRPPSLDMFCLNPLEMINVSMVKLSLKRSVFGRQYVLLWV